MARLVLQGRAGSSGAAVGPLVRLVPTETSSSSHVGRVPGNPLVEQERLHAALARAAADLTELADATRLRAGADAAAIFEAQALFARDPALVEPALAAIATQGLDASQAILRAATTQAEVLSALEDEYFRARAADVRGVGKRVADLLNGTSRPVFHTRSGKPAVVAADDLDASLVAELEPEVVAGLALAGGAPTGHAAIVARALGIPLALGLGRQLLDLPEGEEVLVDGTLGRILVSPAPEERSAIVANGTAKTSACELPVLALPVVVEANAGSAREVAQAAAAGARGIGLFRTELLFLGRTVAPGLEEQRTTYRQIRDAMPDQIVVFRTLDVGGDKPAHYRPTTAEANPALGVRGIRLGLRHPELLEVQLRALLEAAPELPLHVMFPMIATADELRLARAAVVRAAEESRAAGIRVATEVHVGIMVEVPSAALMADALAPEVDFFSIGTNDLIQYTMAADRTNSELADLGTPFEPAVLRLVGQVCRAAQRFARPVAVCGEAAGDPLIAPLLVGLGVTQLSVGANSIREVHESLAGLTLEACRTAAEAAVRAHTSAEVRQIAEAAWSR